MEGERGENLKLRERATGRTCLPLLYTIIHMTSDRDWEVMGTVPVLAFVNPPPAFRPWMTVLLIHKITSVLCAYCPLLGNPARFNNTTPNPRPEKSCMLCQKLSYLNS
jgi:hypothetical protein